MGHYAQRFFGQSYLLDKYVARYAFSLRKLRATYSGKAINVIRSTDSVEYQVGFVGDKLDTEGLMSFIGSATAYVESVYSQGVRSNGQSASLYNNGIIGAQYPVIVENGILCVDENGLPEIRYPSASVITGLSVLTNGGSTYNIPEYEGLLKMSHLYVASFAPSTNSKILINANNVGFTNSALDDIISYNDSLGLVSYQNRSTTGVAESTTSALIYDKKSVIISNVLSESSQSLSINGVNTVTTGLSIGIPTSNAGIFIGNKASGRSATNQFKGSFSEIIFWLNDSIQSDDIRMDIEADIKSYYKIEF